MSTLTQSNVLKCFGRLKSHRLVRGLAVRTTDGVARAVIVGRLTATLWRSEFLLKTTAEFLKAGATSVAALFVQQPVGSLAITVAIVAVAVLAERRINRQP